MAVFKGTKNFYDYEASDILAQNLHQFLDHGLVEIGAFTNITFSNSATSGYTTLKRVYDDRYGKNRVFEGIGAGWVWESGISLVGSTDYPFHVSGVYVGNQFIPNSSSGIFSFNVDYRNGRIVFNNSIPAGSGVKCEYSAKDVNVQVVDSKQWKTIITKYEESFNSLASNSPSGMAEILKQDRAYLPALFVAVNDRNTKGFQLGGGELTTYYVDFYTFADKPFQNRRLLDLLNNQQEVVLNLYNINNSPKVFNYDGTLSSGALTYPALATKTSPYFWSFARIDKSTGGPREAKYDIFRGLVTQEITIERNPSSY